MTTNGHDAKVRSTSFHADIVSSKGFVPNKVVTFHPRSGSLQRAILRGQNHEVQLKTPSLWDLKLACRGGF